MFDIVLDQQGSSGSHAEPKMIQSGRSLRAKRQRKDEKFGYGGKKRFAKSGNAISSGDLGAFSVRKMKAHSTSTRRLGKSRRVKGH